MYICYAFCSLSCTPFLHQYSSQLTSSLTLSQSPPAPQHSRHSSINPFPSIPPTTLHSPFMPWYTQPNWLVKISAASAANTTNSNATDPLAQHNSALSYAVNAASYKMTTATLPSAVYIGSHTTPTATLPSTATPTTTCSSDLCERAIPAAAVAMGPIAGGLLMPPPLPWVHYPQAPKGWFEALTTSTSTEMKTENEALRQTLSALAPRAEMTKVTATPEATSTVATDRDIEIVHTSSYYHYGGPGYIWTEHKAITATTPEAASKGTPSSSSLSTPTSKAVLPRAGAQIPTAARELWMYNGSTTMETHVRSSITSSDDTTSTITECAPRFAGCTVYGMFSPFLSPFLPSLPLSPSEGASITDTSAAVTTTVTT